MWSCADNHTIIFYTSFSLAVAHGSSQVCNLTAVFHVFSVGDLHAASKTSSANGPHLNVWDFDIFATEKNARLRGYSHQRHTFFSAVEILLRIYQNPMHLNGARWGTRFWTHREVHRRKKTRNAAAKLHAWLDPWATANENLVSNIMV